MKFLLTVVFVFFSYGQSRSQGLDVELIGLPIEFDDSKNDEFLWKLKGTEGDLWSANEQQQTQENWDETLAKLCRNNDLIFNDKIVDCDSLEIIPKSLKIDQHEIRKREAQSSNLEEGSGIVPEEDELSEIALTEQLAAKKESADTIPGQPVLVKAILAEAAKEKAVPAEAIAAEPASTRAVPVEAVPAEAVPEEAVPTETVASAVLPNEAVPAEEVPAEIVQEVPAEKIQEVPTEEDPAETVQEVPAGAIPAVDPEVPAEAVPAKTVPEVPVEAVPAETLPETPVVSAETVPEIPAEEVTAETVQEVAVEAVSAGTVPEVPSEAVPAGKAVPAEEVMAVTELPVASVDIASTISARPIKPELVQHSEKSNMDTAKESGTDEEHESVKGKNGVMTKEYLNDKQSGNVVVDDFGRTMEETDAALNKERANASIKNAEEEPKSGESSEGTAQANAGSNKLLIALFVAVCTIGVAAFTYNYVKKKNRSRNSRTVNGDAKIDVEEGKEMKPLMKTYERKIPVEYKDEKEEIVKS